MRQLFAGILLLLFAGSSFAGPRDSKAVNLLLSYKADLKAELKSLEASPAAKWAIDSAPCMLEAKRDWWAFNQLGKKVPIVPGTQLLILERSAEKRKIGLFRKSQGWIARDAQGETLWIPELKGNKQDLREHFSTCSFNRLADSLGVVRDAGMRRFRIDQAKRELDSLKEWRRRYRKEDGAHQRMDPIALLRGQAAPGSNDIAEHLPVAWRGGFSLSDVAWGHSLDAEGKTTILFFQDVHEEVWTFVTQDGDTRFAAPSPERDKNFPRLAAFSRDLSERRKAARQYTLLQRWDPATVERILGGLAWVGMSSDMLLESLGEPSEKIPSGKLEIWRYAMGNELLLEGSKVQSIRKDE